VRVFTAGDQAILEVEDQGPGMTQEDAARVFDRFYRADPSRARASGGVGLGLAIVAAIVYAHRGTVAVHTAPGQGATFRVTLPLLSLSVQPSHEVAGVEGGEGGRVLGPEPEAH
jgi:two-component system OmpR family sensor kinase